MSSKKQLRRERRRQSGEERERARRHPVATFVVAIVLALVAVGVGAFFLRGDARPPFPGAVWSPEHAHWH